MSDFKIDVGFDTETLKRAAQTASTGNSTTNSQTGMSNGIAAGFTKSIKTLGILGFLAGLTLIGDLLGLISGILSSSLGAITALLFQYIIPFFKDPLRFLIPLGVFIINGIITGLEFMTNALIAAFTFGKFGLGSGKEIELPRFRTEIIMEAYDQMKAVAEDGNSSAKDLADANKQFFKNFMASFLTDDQFEIIKQSSLNTKVGMLDTLDAIKGDANAYESFVKITFNDSSEAVSAAFRAVNKLMADIENRANKAMGSSKRVSPGKVAAGSMLQTFSDPKDRQRYEKAYGMLFGTDFTQNKYNTNILGK